NLEVKWSGGAASFPFENAFQVTPGIGPRLEAALLAPNAIRPGRAYTLLIRYQNTGDADMTAPVLLLQSEADIPLGLDPGMPLEKKPVRFLAIPREGPAGILPPGAEGSIAVYFQSGAANRISFRLEAIQDLNSLVTWDAPEWTAYVDTVGPTWGDYQDALAAMATDLWRQGVTLADADELLARLLDPIQQKPGGEIHGRLVDEEYGHPQAGASILIQNISSSGIPAFSTTTDTDAEGQFEFVNLPAGVYSIQVNGYPSVNPNEIGLSEGQILSGVEWRVPYGGIIEGTVYEMPARLPFEGVMLTLQDGLGEIRAVVTDEKGTYRFPALPAGLYSLEALHPSYAAKRYDGLQVWNGRALKEVDFLLEPSVYLNGVVKDADTGQTIASPMIYIKNPQGSLLPAWSFEDGTFSISELAPGTYELRCQADGYQVLAPLDVTVPETGLNGLAITMKRGASCQGRVLDASNGSPLENAILLFTNLAAQTSDTAQTDALGNFTVSRLTPGGHSVWINATGYELQIRMIEIQGGAANTLGDVLLPPGGSITGRVLDSDGITPLADSLVSAVSVDGVVLGMVMSDAQGMFVFRNLPTRSLTLSALLADYTFPQQTIQVNGTMEGITLTAASGKIAGTITAGTSALAVENAIIEAVPIDPGADARQGSMASTGADGQYQLNHLVPGNYLLAVTAPGLGRMTKRVTL
nr:carboxypeptidase regulatory-like domain-containing protein [bacterium]